MVEVLQELRQRVLSPHEAAAVMALAGDLQGVDRAVGASAEQQLRQHVQPATAPGIMALALAHNNQQLQVHDGWLRCAAALCHGATVPAPTCPRPQPHDKQPRHHQRRKLPAVPFTQTQRRTAWKS